MSFEKDYHMVVYFCELTQRNCGLDNKCHLCKVAQKFQEDGEIND